MRATIMHKTHDVRIENVADAAKGAEPIVARLAAFNLTSVAYQPPPAIYERQAAPEASRSAEAARGDEPELVPIAAPTPSAAPAQQGMAPSPARPPASRRGLESADLVSKHPMQDSSSDETGDATVRAFYGALEQANGETASAQIIAEKRSSRAFSPEAIWRFYGRLAEPLRLTGIAPVAPDRYRVNYRYSTGRWNCNGSADVSLTNRGGREFIGSIHALSGC